MAQFAVIDQSRAPAQPPPHATSYAEQMRQYEGYVRGLKKGQAGRLTPVAPETTRGLVVRVGRAAKRLGTDVETWTADGAVYFAVR